jgi:hypothetical protein
VLLLPHLMGFLGVQAAQSFSDVLTFIVTIPLQGRVLRSLRIRKEKG